MNPDTISQNATQHFQNGFLCSESVLKAICEEKGIESEAIQKMATVFGRGLADTNSICGALSGGYLALSMMQGRTSNEESIDTLYANIAQLKKNFSQKFGETLCPKLLGFSLTDTDGGEKFVQQDCKKLKCSKYIEFVTKEVTAML